jgi:hypothetical protein
VTLPFILGDISKADWVTDLRSTGTYKHGVVEGEAGGDTAGHHGRHKEGWLTLLTHSAIYILKEACIQNVYNEAKVTDKPKLPQLAFIDLI